MVVGRQSFPFVPVCFSGQNVTSTLVFGGASEQVLGARVYVVLSHEIDLHLL